MKNVFELLAPVKMDSRLRGNPFRHNRKVQKNYSYLFTEMQMKSDRAFSASLRENRKNH
jgi:hypothetical protein